MLIKHFFKQIRPKERERRTGPRSLPHQKRERKPRYSIAVKPSHVRYFILINGHSNNTSLITSFFQLQAISRIGRGKALHSSLLNKFSRYYVQSNETHLVLLPYRGNKIYTYLIIMEWRLFMEYIIYNKFYWRSLLM